MIDLTEMVKDFLVESYENLDQLDRDLVALEQDPSSESTLGSIFRTIHTIKGTCGFLGFDKLESVTHVGENLLSKMRDGELTIDPDITSGLLGLIDAVRDMLSNIETAGAEGETDYSELVARLNRLQGRRLEGAGESESLPAAQPATSAADQSPAPAPDQTAHEMPEFVESVTRIGNILIDQYAVRPEDIAETLDRQNAGDPRSIGELLIAEGKAAPEQVQGALKTQQEARGGLAEGSIRVDVGLLDKLMNQVGELVLARNQILQFTTTLNDSAFLSTSQRLNLITTELQEGVMKTRMQPIGNIWSKFPRVVRDLALQCKKSVRIEMEGKETELDKTIVEAIKDPLTHLVRNAVDHGIESPEERIAKGKPAEGCLLLRAFHEGGQVNIEITDDGAGLNLDRIKQKAIERGLITADHALRMGDRDTAMLIFAPGFSTAAKVTNVSGRGVGMDVVKTNVEKIGGAVDIQSQFGQGSTVKIKIPLTLAIIPALVITCGGDRYAIPQVSLLELVRLEGEQARSGIERLHGAPVYRLRGQLLPIVDLRRELRLDAQHATDSARDTSNDIVNIVVLRADDRQFGLVVDAINDTEEIVVKPLSKQLKRIPIYAGSTIMGDGTVALILDVLGTAQRAHVVSEVRDRTMAKHPANSQANVGDRQTLLILAIGDRRVALPISMVARLEKIAQSEIERSDNREVVQYRGEILPLVRLDEVLGIATTRDDERPLQVVVYSEQGRSVGLVVDRIADIVESAVESSRRSQNENLIASAVIQDRVTDLLNLPTIIRRMDPSFYEPTQTA